MSHKIGSLANDINYEGSVFQGERIGWEKSFKKGVLELDDYLRADPENGPCQREVLAEYTNNNNRLLDNLLKR